MSQRTVLRFVIAVASVLPVFVERLPLSSAAEPPAGKLYCVVTDERSTFFQLGLMNADGSDFKIVPTAKTFSLYPAPSPDGSRLAYLAFDRNQGLGPTAMKLYLSGADGADPVRLTDSVAIVSWTPDGESLLATRLLFRDGEQVGSRLEVLNLDGTVTKELGPGCCAAWSAVENRLACITTVNGRSDFRLTLMNADGRGREVVDRTADGDPLRVSPYCCVWSPDARQVAVAQRVGDGEHPITFLALVDVESRKLRHVARLSTKDGDLLTASWSPDGKWLAYAVEQADRSRVFVVPVEGGTARAVSPADRHCFMPSWSR